MTGIIACTQDEEEHIAWLEGIHEPRGADWSWQTTRPRRNWHKGAHLTLIVTGGYRGTQTVSRLGWTRRVRQADDLGEKLELTRIRKLPRPVELRVIVDRLPPSARRHLVTEGQQPGGTGKALLNALIELSPDAQLIISSVSQAVGRYPIGDSRAGQILSFQRDGTLVAVRMSGMVIPELSRWDPPLSTMDDSDIPPTFIDRIAPALEDHLIGQDAQRMMGWLTSSTGHVAWKVFEQFDQQLLVANVNRTPAESTLGVDLVYYTCRAAV